MPVAYLTAAIFSGITMTLLWLFAGGGWLSSFFVYVMSGNLVLAGLILRSVLRSDPTDVTPDDDENNCAKEA